MEKIKVQSIEITYLNVTDPLIILLIFVFLSYHEKAHDNKEFSQENSKPCLNHKLQTVMSNSVCNCSLTDIRSMQAEQPLQSMELQKKKKKHKMIKANRKSL